MDRILYQLTVLMAGGCVGMLLLSSYFDSFERGLVVESRQQTAEVNQQVSK